MTYKSGARPAKSLHSDVESEGLSNCTSPITTTILNNGLRILHRRVSDTQMLAFNILYGVGARDEQPTRTGFAHLFEHLMFGGSRNAPHYDTPVQLAGGENNAWTTNDLTNFYITLPAVNAETAFFLESDRMANLLLTPQSLEVQRKVVVEEFKQRYLNAPYGDLHQLTRALSYTTHPYRWATIGLEPQHIEDATLEEVQAFYHKYYTPENAVLSIVGNVELDEALRLSEKYFGGIEPTHSIRSKSYPQEPQHVEQRRMTVERDVPCSRLVITFSMCARFHSDFYIYDMLTDLLALGKSGILTTRLCNEQQLFTHIDAYVEGSLDEGLLVISGTLVDGVSLENAEQAVWEVLTNLQFTNEEMQKSKNQFATNLSIDRLNYATEAYELAFYIHATGSLEEYHNAAANHGKTTRDDLHRIAQRTFTPQNSNVLYYRSRCS